MKSAIPSYHLYGEGPAEAERSFLHVERVARRSSRHAWDIPIHAHPDHHQILLLSQGSGAVRLEDRILHFRTSELVLVLALTAHAFRFEPQSDGHVVTVSTDFMDAALEGDSDLLTLFDAPGRVLPASPDDLAGLRGALGRLESEFVWPAPGRRLAIKAGLQQILVSAMRLQIGASEGKADLRRADAFLVARYRKLIEARFREQIRLPIYAAALGVTTARLNAAARTVTGRSALTLVHDRIVVDAKRHLLYTGMTVSGIAAMLGFDDPAYFSRFFVSRVGVTPGAYRAAGHARAG